MCEVQGEFKFHLNTKVNVRRLQYTLIIDIVKYSSRFEGYSFS